MFSNGQKIFGILFAVVFIITIVWSYRKDLKLHQKQYKNVWKIGLGILLIFALFAGITFLVQVLGYGY